MFVNSKGATIINECLSSDGKRINLPNHVFEETYVAIDVIRYNNNIIIVKNN